MKTIRRSVSVLLLALMLQLTIVQGLAQERQVSQMLSTSEMTMVQGGLLPKPLCQILYEGCMYVINESDSCHVLYLLCRVFDIF